MSLPEMLSVDVHHPITSAKTRSLHCGHEDMHHSSTPFQCQPHPTSVMECMCGTHGNFACQSLTETVIDNLMHHTQIHSQFPSARGRIVAN